MAGPKAKTASKNNPSARKSAKEFFYNKKVVIPIKFVSSEGSMMSAAYKDTREIILDPITTKPILWDRVISVQES